MNEITIEEFIKLKKSDEKFQLIDVREPYEFSACNLGGELISLGEIPRCVDKISREKKVILHCRSGGRSLKAVKWLKKNHEFDNVYSLKGGIMAWIKQVDPAMEEKCC